VRGQRGIHQGAGQPGHGSQGSAAHSGEVGQLARHQCCGAGAEIKLLPGADAEITNPAPAPAPFYNLFIKDLQIFYRKKSWLLKKIFQIITILILFG
jgi:hypothetical protein